jgi:hypothetical protein
MDGIKNRTVQLYFLGLVEYLDKVKLLWRDNHVILLDKMSSTRLNRP